MKTSKLVTKVKMGLPVPDKNFVTWSVCDFNIELVQEHSDYTVNDESRHYIKEECFYKTFVPDFLYNYLVDSHPDYNKIEYLTPDIKGKHFSKTVRFSSFGELYNFFLKMSNDAVFIKRLEQLEDNSKVIFIKNDYYYGGVRDDYNHADMNKRVSLNFNYFVAYEVAKINSFTGKEEYLYYGLKRKRNSLETVSMSHYRNELPVIPNVYGFIKMKWTKERQDFLEQVEDKIVIVIESINNFVKNLNEETFELTMSKIKLLELKNGDVQ